MQKPAMKGIYNVGEETTPTGQESYHISGYTEAGVRIRQRLWRLEEVKKEIDDLREKDKIYLKAQASGASVLKENKRVVWSSEIIITESRKNDCEAALRLFPKDESGMPKKEYLLEKAVDRGLKAGYNPILPEITFSAVQSFYTEHIKWRLALPKDHDQRITKIYADMLPYYCRLSEGIFGGMYLSEMAIDGVVESGITNSGLTVDNSQKVASYVNQLMAWAMINNSEPRGQNPPPAHVKYIESYTTFYPKSKKRGRVVVMSVPEVQARIDSAWDLTIRERNSRAAREILLIFAALRPSELDHPEFRLDENCRMARVPDDSKTGWRDVLISPNAQIMLRALKSDGLLMFDRPSYQTLGIWHGQIGYYLGFSRMRSHVASVLKRRYKDVTSEEAEKWFRERYPLRPEFGENVTDKPRHTGASNHVTACQDVGITCNFIGDTNVKTVKKHYWGRIDIEYVPAFYQVLATALHGAHPPEKIDMPYWFKAQHAEHFKAERAKVQSATDAVVIHMKREGDDRAKAQKERVRARLRKSHERNKEGRNERRRALYQNNSERRELVKTRNRQSHAAHADERNAKRREAYASDELVRQQRLQANRESVARQQERLQGKDNVTVSKDENVAPST
jgi:hypothetical protein